jgi:hypothetical protein
MFYGLKKNGAMYSVIFWRGKHEPDVFDFNIMFSNVDDIEIIPVKIVEI